MSQQNSPDAPKWVERIFARLLVRYGASWLRMWEGVPMDAVKADWGNALARIAHNSPDRIRYALEYLPDQPPNLGQFMALCNRAPTREAARIPAPAGKPRDVDMQRLAELAERLRSNPQHPKAWIGQLRQRISEGYKPTEAQRLTLLEAEREGFTTPGDGGGFTPIPRHLWPEAMQRELPEYPQ